MITYVCLGTNDLDRAARFYDATLAALGYGRYDMSNESGHGSRSIYSLPPR